MCAALAAQEPWWEPGTQHGYHAITFGYLVGEVIRRITGKTPGTYLREEIAGPLKLDVHIGVDASFDPRIAETDRRAAATAGQARSTREDERRSGIDDVQGDRESACRSSIPH